MTQLGDHLLEGQGKIVLTKKGELRATECPTPVLNNIQIIKTDPAAALGSLLLGDKAE